MARTLLISIQPRYADSIFSGMKTIELRRTRPSVTKGDMLAIYVSAPAQELRGIARISGVAEATPAQLWSQMGHRSGVTYQEFIQYFAGTSHAYGILLSAIERLPTPRSLKQLRDDIPGFCPPQVYRYLDPTQLSLLGISAAERRRAA